MTRAADQYRTFEYGDRPAIGRQMDTQCLSVRYGLRAMHTGSDGDPVEDGGCLPWCGSGISLAYPVSRVHCLQVGQWDNTIRFCTRFTGRTAVRSSGCLGLWSRKHPALSHCSGQPARWTLSRQEPSFLPGVWPSPPVLPSASFFQILNTAEQIGVFG
ncbi:hypothetical protein NXW50_10495 [Bacteroides thetaiotaomicron]|nr:hypothetical protein [Bacteroides thetaiotaomicron]MCS2278611.1 hypothetical protein [Bacteroides thetaiotaomicron]